MKEKLDCEKCSKSFGSFDSLRRHMSRIHKIQSQHFYVDFYFGGKWPVCACGCGEKVKWSHTDKRFREFSAVGHLNRVRNNWGHNKKAIENSADTRREQYKNGERVTWCKGKTKETDERIRNLAEKTKKTINSNPKELKRRSEFMKEQRRNGNLPTLYGPNSSQWKGGVSEINNIARNDKRLYDEWKYPILIRDGFKCIKCGSSDNLHIHHDKEQMCEIVQKHCVADIDISDFELKKSIASKIVDYHINNVSGITLCSKCHNDLHPSLNFKH